MMDLVNTLEPARDRYGIVHARAIHLSGSDTLVCALLKMYLDQVLRIRIREWTFPVTCLWCFVRLVRA